MSFNTSTAPYLVVAAVAGGPNAGSSATAGNVWCYRTTDAFSTVVGTSYFTDAYLRGIRKFDTMMIIDTNTPRATWAFVTAVTTATSSLQTGGGATVTLFSST